MPKHYLLLSTAKQQYELLVLQAKKQLDVQLIHLFSQFQCAACEVPSEALMAEWLAARHPGCGYRAGQKAALRFLEEKIGFSIVEKLNTIQAARNAVSCHQCGVCCQMASADADYETLVQRAKAGDAFAQQFTSIFLPYASRDAARSVLPHVVDAVLKEAEGSGAKQEQIFFYHCPYLGEDKRCTVYGTARRPALCEQYPETPLGYVYESCAWQPWKEAHYDETQMAHALLAIAQGYQAKLKAALAE